MGQNCSNWKASVLDDKNQLYISVLNRGRGKMLVQISSGYLFISICSHTAFVLGRFIS